MNPSNVQAGYQGRPGVVNGTPTPALPSHSSPRYGGGVKAYWTGLVAAALAAWLTVWADTTDDEYVRIYNQIQQADQLVRTGQTDQARQRYEEARQALQSLQQHQPDWNPRVVEFRLRYIAAKLAALPAPPLSAPPETPAQPVPATQPPAPRESPAQPAPPAKARDPEAEVKALEERVRQLEADKMVLTARLHEALAGQPAAVDPREFAKAEDRIKVQQKEIEELRANLRRAEGDSSGNAATGASASSERALAQARQELADQSEKLATLTLEKQGLQTLLSTFTKPEGAQALREENARLRAQLQQADLPPKPAATPDDLQRQLAAVQTALGEAQTRVGLLEAEKQVLEKQSSALERERDELHAKFTAVSRELLNRQLQDRPPEFTRLTNELTALKARLDVLEAQRTPYSTEELALFKASTSADRRSPPPQNTRPKMEGSTPPASWTVAGDSARAKRRAERTDQPQPTEPQTAAPDVSEWVREATRQFDQTQLAEAEATVQKALAASPGDAASLSLLGRVRYKQDRIDEAFDALSRSAQLDPDNAETFHYLGLTLSRKGLRDAAESALRRAVLLSPGLASAHHNLAVVYATERPPALELARHHYRKARAAGEPADPQLEKLLGETPPAKPAP